MSMQIFNSITELQNREKQLHHKFHNDTPEQNQLYLDEMRELTNLRVEMFDQMKSGYARDARDIEHSVEELEGEIDTLYIIENELNHAQERMRKLNQEYVNKMRMVEISTYSAENYKGYNGLMKLIIMWVIPISVLIYIGVRNPIPETYISKGNSSTLFLVLILGIICIALYQILNMTYDLKTRNNMNFNEYDFGGSVMYDNAVKQYGSTNKDDMSILAYDEDRLKGLSLNLGCIDSSCCADGTIYDSLKKQCIPAIKTHIENTKKAEMTKGAMSQNADDVHHITTTGNSVESFRNFNNCPYASV
jgi:hypothetical protein